jgi:hypothetical protein
LLGCAGEAGPHGSGVVALLGHAVKLGRLLRWAAFFFHFSLLFYSFSIFKIYF